MPTALNVLIVEDSAADAALLVDELQNVGYELQWSRVDNEEDYSASLSPHLNIIFSDFSLPRFSTQRALELFHESNLDIPFIVVSGTIGEERAVEILKAGATDYVLKDRMSRRLGIVVQRALRAARDRAERRKLKCELAARDQQLKSFFSNATAGLCIIDRELRYIQINEVLANMNGFTVRDHIGRTVREVLPEIAAELEPILQRVVDTGEPALNLELSGFTHAQPGVIQHWIVSHFPLMGDDAKPIGLGSVVVDITEKKRAEESLRASEEKFRLIADTIDEVFWSRDLESNRFLFVSPACERVWGKTIDSLYADPQSLLDAVYPEDREQLTAILNAQKSGQPHDVEYRILRPDGSVRWVWDHGCPVRTETGKVTHSVGVAQDVTDRKQLQAQLMHAQKMESIGQLAGGVAHDFNNILMLILGHAQLMSLEPNLTETIRESTEQITIAGERAASLTRQLLTLSRRQVIQTKYLDLNEIIDGIAKMLIRVMGEDIDLDFAPGNIPAILADAGMLEQVLMNLAVNARDAMPSGGTFILQTDVESITQATAEQNPEASAGDYVRLTVADTGCGIPAENIGKVFEPFFTTKEVGKGTGLGLATVYGIVRQHRGWITVDSKVSEGTTFKIYFPATRARTAADHIARPIEKIRGGNETVLIVEDEAALRRLVRHLLESYGYYVLDAESGRSALQRFGGIARKIDLLLTDLVMPGGVSGRELAERLRAMNPKLRVIYMSGYSLNAVAKDIELQEGVNFFQKPYALHALAKCVRNSLDSR